MVAETPPHRGSTRHRLQLLLAAFLFSTGGVAIKGCSLTAWQIGCYRSALAGAVVAILIPEARRHWTWRTMLVGLPYAATLTSFVVANKLTTSANAIFLQATAPLYLLFLGPLVLKERIGRRDIAVCVSIAGGIGLLLAGSQTGGGRQSIGKGDLIALASGLFWACTIAGLRWLGKHEAGGGGATATVVAGNLIAGVLCLAPALHGNAPSAADVAVILYLGVFQVAGAYCFLTGSIRHVPGFEAATLLLAEPVLNPFWTWLLRGERPAPLVLAGGAAIIFSALAGQYRPVKRR